MTETPQPKWTKYRRTQIAEMIDWTPGFDMTAVSVSDADQKNGSPRAGDKIAHNPANHEDRWLIAADYFAANFEPVAAEEQRHATEPHEFVTNYNDTGDTLCSECRGVRRPSE